MKIYRLIVEGDGPSKLVVYDSSEIRMMRDYDHAIKSRWTTFAEVSVISGPAFIKRAQLLDALNGRADQWKFLPLVGYERK